MLPLPQCLVLTSVFWFSLLPFQNTHLYVCALLFSYQQCYTSTTRGFSGSFSIVFWLAVVLLVMGLRKYLLFDNISVCTHFYASLSCPSIPEERDLAVGTGSSLSLHKLWTSPHHWGRRRSYMQTGVKPMILYTESPEDTVFNDQNVCDSLSFSWLD
jgi:hypothetical protein